MELDNLYQEVILDHYKRPQNKKLSQTFDAQVHHVNPSCGDEIDLNLTIVDGVVTNISWDGVGCSISQASVSILSDLLTGKPIAQAYSIFDQFVALMQSKGAVVGDEEVGASEGDTVGLRDGTVVGERDGELVGARVGAVVGYLEGA